MAVGAVITRIWDASSSAQGDFEEATASNAVNNQLMIRTMSAEKMHTNV